ncbi:glycerol dehydrogenase [Salinirubrum litoreum]|uniref:Glycerol dehydrogenase n=1 Tax=Salinirubrum litoreum TaxID=1126234 RepID=A0ABD5RAT7_9EURY|nr:glycerol dehydrogenase [Salinirubrum litoreum]
MTRSFVSAPRYVQGVGVLSELGSHVEGVGTTALVITDDVVHDVVVDGIDGPFSGGAATYHAVRFGGECTDAEITRLSAIARDRDADVIVGAGGGKAIDVAKAVRGRVGGALVSLPTIASTDAPTSGISVVYSEDGRLDGGIVHDRRPDLVLVDTGVVARAPTRWFVSGVGDALATRFEATATVESGGETVAGGQPTRAGVALARQCYEVLRSSAPAAVTAVNDGTVTDAVEETTEAIVLLSGLGFENGGLAAAHAVHDGIVSAVETDATHGEKVCFGLLTQLVLEGRETSTVREVARFASDLGLPVTLDAIGVPTDRVDAVAEAACSSRTSMGNQPGNPTPADVESALLGADDVGHSL